MTSITLFGCAGSSPQPQAVSLAVLATAQDAYDGSRVIAEGTVQTYDQPRHYWIEDIEQHRVELSPHELVKDLVGQRIRVTGRFSFRDDRGRGIDIDDLEVMDVPPTALSSTVGAGRGSPDATPPSGAALVTRDAPAAPAGATGPLSSA